MTNRFSMVSLLAVILAATIATNTVVNAFVPPVQNHRSNTNTNSNSPLARTTTRTTTPLLFASKKKKSKSKPSGMGGGFGGKTATVDTTTAATARPKPVRADKTALETQWDLFAAITDLEIRPPEDDDCEHFEVVDVFVGGNTNTNTNDDDGAHNNNYYYRIGKVCVSESTPIRAGLGLQKGLILWTAVHMRKELLARGKAGARALQVKYTPSASIATGSETDGPLEIEDLDLLETVEKPTPDELSQTVPKSFGFRPDWNPPGFTYKRREKAALGDRNNKKSSSTAALLRELHQETASDDDDEEEA